MTTPLDAANAAAIDAAHRLIQAYADAVDANDLTTVVALFADDAELITPSAHYHGRAEIEAFFAPRIDRPSHHLITPIADDVVAEGVVECHSTLTEGATRGSYVDRIAVRGNEARFIAKSIELETAQ